MKLMLLSAGSVIHTQRWANGLVAAGVEVLCLSQHEFLPSGWDARVQRELLPRRGIGGYFLNGRAVAKWFARSGCDLLNAHYATGYGVLAMRSGVRPRLVSVWGSDVYDFPAVSVVHRALVRRVLHSADGVASTSHAMAQQVARVMTGWPLKRAVAVTPFGVDTARFQPPTATESRALVIGTVKTLAPKYGIDTLIRGFAMLDSRGAAPVRLCIAGDGPQRAELEALARTLGVSDRVHFAGALAHAAVPAQLHGFDIFVAASRLDSESFGVAVIEASACGLPVVVTRVGGLPEVVKEGETGLVVERDDPAALAFALQRLLDDSDMRVRFGRNGRARVRAEYEWQASVQHMIGVYAGLLGRAETSGSIA